MMHESAIALGIELRPLVEADDGATGRVVVTKAAGSPADPGAVESLVDGADVLTFEHEHIPREVLDALAERLPIEPAPDALVYAQDKIAMRERLTALGIPCPRWAVVRDEADLAAFAADVGWPVIVKTPTGGYDGHGVHIAHGARDAADWFAPGPLLAEELVPFACEAAALLARSRSGQIRSWPVALTEQEDSVCSVVTAPARALHPRTRERARAIAERIARELDVTGVLAVEMFVVGTGADERVLVNELAMRPHNTGHWTIDGSITGQFEQHLRAVLDLPLGSTDLIVPGSSAVMVNLLGSDLPDPARALGDAMRAGGPTARIHLYGKEVRPGRKLGHVTVVDPDPARALELARAAVAALRGEQQPPAAAPDPDPQEPR
ncbi:5-(carboxyamino)imidazole ribonucleotide synthase [Actinomyces sp. B33]|nr:5-(carboxyamino)imidazole ribonucleotide synthase [Actinomyces sp. B33]